MGRFTSSADTSISRNPDLFDEAPVRGRKVAPQAPRPRPASSAAVSPWKVRIVRGLGLAGIGALMLPIAAAGLGLGALAGWLNGAPPIVEFENYNPPEVTMITDKDGKQVAALYEQRRFVVSSRTMPDDLKEAFVSIEDERFYRHFGVDPQGLARAMFVNLKRGRFSQGASTITQQTARNLLPRVGTAKTTDRKVREMLVAMQMEHSYTKDQILEVYLNQIYLGSGTYGVEAAARAYFGKSSADLTLAEIATLAGLPQIPERYSPLNNPELAQTRRDMVLAKMVELGVVTDAAYGRAVTEQIAVNPERIARSRAPYFVDAVRRLVASNAQLGGDKLQTAGWRIQATIDPVAQDLAEKLLRESLDAEEVEWLTGRRERYMAEVAADDFLRPPAVGQIRMAQVVRIFSGSLVLELPGAWRADVDIPAATASYFAKGATLAEGDGVDVEVTGIEAERGLFRARLLPRQRMQGAVVVMDLKSGEVRALVGGREYNDHPNNGFFNRAILGRRPAGSTMKPLFFAAAMENGMTPWTILYDSRMSFADGYTPRNFENRFFGPTSIQTALEHSRNIPTIKMTQAVGLNTALDYVRRFQRGGDRAWALPRELPVVLGTTAVSPLELAAAYQAIGNGGLARGPRLVRGVWNEADREAITIQPPEEEQLISSHADAYMVQMMQGVMGHGTGSKVRDLLPEDLRDRVAGKSGTTNDNRDAWFAGFTPHEAIVVWIGFDQHVPLAPTRTGSRAAGPVWGRIASAIWETKTPEERAANLILPEGYVMAAVHPFDGRILLPGSPDWVDPPNWRAMTNDEFQRRSPSIPSAPAVPETDEAPPVYTEDAPAPIGGMSREVGWSPAPVSDF